MNSHAATPVSSLNARRKASPVAAPVIDVTKIDTQQLDLDAYDLWALLRAAEALVVRAEVEGASGIDGDLSVELQRLMRMAADHLQALSGRVMPDELPFLVADAEIGEALLAAIAARVSGLVGRGLQIRRLMAYAEWRVGQLLALLQPAD